MRTLLLLACVAMTGCAHRTAKYNPDTKSVDYSATFLFMRESVAEVYYAGDATGSREFKMTGYEKDSKESVASVMQSMFELGLKAGRGL